MGGGDLGELQAQRASLVVVGAFGICAHGERIDEALPLAGRAGPLLELAHRGRLGRSELERLHRVAERRGLVGELVPGDDGELLVECTFLGGSDGRRGRSSSGARAVYVREENLVERRQARPLLLGLVERHERGGGAPIVGTNGEHALVGAEGALWRLELLLVERRCAEREIDLEREIGAAIRGAGEHLDEALPVVRLRVEIGQPVEVTDGEVALAQDPERLRMTRRQLEDTTPRAERAGVILEPVGEHAAELLQHHELRGGIVGEVRAPFERVGDGDEVLVTLGLLFERIERDGVVRLLREDQLVDARGVRAAVEALGGHLGHLHPERASFVGGLEAGPLGLALVEIVELPVRPALRVELLQLGDRLAVLGLGLAQLLEGLDRVLHIGELIEPATRDGAVELGLRAGVRLELREPHLRGEEIAPAPQRLVDASELAHGIGVGAVERDDLREHRDQRGVALDVLAIDLRDVAQHREARRGVVGGDALELGAQEIGEVVERARGAIEALQRVTRGDVRGLGAEQRAPLLDGLLGVGAVLGEAGDLGGELAALGPVGHRALRIGQDLHEPRLLTALRAPLAEEGEHPGMRGLGLAELLEVRFGRLRLLAHPPVHHRDLEHHADLLALAHAARRELTLVERDEVFPHTGVGEVMDERARRLRLTGREIEDAFVDADGALLRADLLLEDAGEADERGELLVLRGRLRRERLERSGEIFPSLLGAEHALLEEHGAAVLGIEGQRLLQEAEDLLDEIEPRLRGRAVVTARRARRVDIRRAPLALPAVFGLRRGLLLLALLAAADALGRDLVRRDVAP